MAKYYVEFKHTVDEESYCLQSKWFDTKEEAINFAHNFDYARYLDIRLMSSEFDENGDYGDIQYESIIELNSPRELDLKY